MDSGGAKVFGSGGDLVNRFTRQTLGAAGFDEKWLQEVLFHNIDLINVTDPTYDKVRIVPLCREFSLNDGFRNLFLDILAITETGRLILIECKLWKNPSARREVLAQIFEYATLMQSLSYSDLSAKLKKTIQSGKEDPIAHVFKTQKIEFNEALLINRIMASLARGDFHIIIAGDGIRADLANLVNAQAMRGMLANLTLLELSVYKDETGQIMLIPRVPVKTETMTRTVLLSPDGQPATIEDEEETALAEPTKSGVRRKLNEEKKAMNAAFWAEAIKAISFDHPDQESLKKRGNNFCHLPMPEPLGRITAWRTKDRIGAFIRLTDDDADQHIKFFEERIDAMKSEISPDIDIGYPDNKRDWSNAYFIGTVLEIDTQDPKTAPEQIKWLNTTLNKFVNYLRPIIGEMER